MGGTSVDLDGGFEFVDDEQAALDFGDYLVLLFNWWKGNLYFPTFWIPNAGCEVDLLILAR